MIEEIIHAIYLFLPAGLANLTPALFYKAKWMSTPVDFGKSWNGKRIFGDHKTFRGYLIAIITAILVVFVQNYLGGFSSMSSYSINYRSFSVAGLIGLGFLFGFGAMFGDSVKSFFKRRLGVQPGKPWKPWDQIDFVIGGIVFSAMVVSYSLFDVIVLLISMPLLHILIRRIGFWLKLNDGAH